jgi:hypothetical protein
MRKLWGCDGAIHLELVSILRKLGVKDCGCASRCEKLALWWRRHVSKGPCRGEVARLQQLAIDARAKVWQLEHELAQYRGEPAPPEVDWKDLASQI